MGIKLKAIQVTLTNDEVVIVHEPRLTDMGAYFRAMPALIEMGRALDTMQAAIDDHVYGLPSNLTPELIEEVLPVLERMTVRTLPDGSTAPLLPEEWHELPLWDGLALLRTLGEFVPKNAVTTQATS